MRTRPMPDAPDGYEYEPAPAHVQATLRLRFEDQGITAMHTHLPNAYLHNFGNFWDGPYTVIDNGDGSFSYTSPYTKETDRFDANGYWTRNGEYRLRSV